MAAVAKPVGVAAGSAGPAETGPGEPAGAAVTGGAEPVGVAAGSAVPGAGAHRAMPGFTAVAAEAEQ
ncbi:hypothetical protein C3477_14990 [Mycobacterium kansasii]|nr:hypothetical protein C3477_14990 [Mycobacterium kansasii]